MITRKDLAPLDDASLEIWRNDLKHRKDETLYALYDFCQDICDDWRVYDYCQSCKLTMVEVKNELVKRSLSK